MEPMVMMLKVKVKIIVIVITTMMTVAMTAEVMITATKIEEIRKAKVQG